MNKGTLLASFAALSCAALWFLKDSNNLTVSRYFYTSKKVSPSLSGFKIAHVSDLHNKLFGSRNCRLLSLIKSQRPDIIVISGDLVDSRHTDIPVSLEFVKEASKIAPVYYTTGNHEHRFPQKTFEGLMSDIEKAGATVLVDKTVTVTHGNDSFLLTGISDKTAMSGDCHIIPRGKSDRLCLLIAHRPQFAKRYVDAGADLIFSGHAHGGQVRLPILGGVLAPDQFFFPKYCEGVHRFGDHAEVISRGLGNSLIPIRVNNPPELVMVTLKNGISIN